MPLVFRLACKIHKRIFRENKKNYDGIPLDSEM